MQEQGIESVALVSELVSFRHIPDCFAAAHILTARDSFHTIADHS